MTASLLCLCGIAGSGKSTFADGLRVQGWVVIQHVPQHQHSCEQACLDALHQGCNVVIDSCNLDAAQRAPWVFLASRMPLHRVRLIAVELRTPAQECERRLRSRQDLAPSNVPALLNSMLQAWRPVDSREGFHDILRMSHPSELPALVHAVLHSARQHQQQQQQNDQQQQHYLQELQQQHHHHHQFPSYGWTGGAPIPRPFAGASYADPVMAPAHHHTGFHVTNEVPHHLAKSHWTGAAGAAAVHPPRGFLQAATPGVPFTSPAAAVAPAHGVPPGSVTEAWEPMPPAPPPPPYAELPQRWRVARHDSHNDASVSHLTVHDGLTDVQPGAAQSGQLQGATPAAAHCDGGHVGVHGPDTAIDLVSTSGGVQAFDLPVEAVAHARAAASHTRPDIILDAGADMEAGDVPAAPHAAASHRQQCDEPWGSGGTGGSRDWSQASAPDTTLADRRAHTRREEAPGYATTGRRRDDDRTRGHHTNGFQYRGRGGGRYSSSSKDDTRALRSKFANPAQTRKYDEDDAAIDDLAVDHHAALAGAAASCGGGSSSRRDTSQRPLLPGANSQGDASGERDDAPLLAKVARGDAGGMQGAGAAARAASHETELATTTPDPLTHAVLSATPAGAGGVPLAHASPPSNRPMDLAPCTDPTLALASSGLQEDGVVGPRVPPAVASSSLQGEEGGVGPRVAPTPPRRDSRPILLFDLNGTLTSHTSVRMASGVTLPRPGTAALLRLKEHFRLGIYTSSTVRTVDHAARTLEATAGGTLFEPRLVLYRDHTQPAPQEHCASTGQAWDTVKPLGRWFSRLHRVLLFDDDAYKSMPGEERNMVLVPCWAEGDDACSLVERLVDALIEVIAPLPADADLRDHSSALSARLAASVASPVLTPAGPAVAAQADDVSVATADDPLPGGLKQPP